MEKNLFINPMHLHNITLIENNCLDRELLEQPHYDSRGLRLTFQLCNIEVINLHCIKIMPKQISSVPICFKLWTFPLS